MLSIKQSDWQSLPSQAQQEVYDFFLFVKQKYSDKNEQSETRALSDHSANLIDEWQLPEEDEVWK